jgi:hypothetical protein
MNRIDQVRPLENNEALASVLGKLLRKMEDQDKEVKILQQENRKMKDLMAGLSNRISDIPSRRNPTEAKRKRNSRTLSTEKVISLPCTSPTQTSPNQHNSDIFLSSRQDSHYSPDNSIYESYISDSGDELYYSDPDHVWNNQYPTNTCTRTPMTPKPTSIWNQAPHHIKKTVQWRPLGRAENN